jgi:plastocyanin
MKSFTGPVIQIAPGATVTWAFDDDGRPHNVVGDGWSSDVAESGTYRRTFSVLGSYPYRCTLHWGMDGRVEVAEQPSL